jgi:hypothetical protein
LLTEVGLLFLNCRVADPAGLYSKGAMNLKDYIGKRGEKIFSVLITKFCDGKPWFDDTFLGEKAEARDFLVNLVEPTSGDAIFYVQVKATSKGYTHKGTRLKANVTEKEIQKLQKINAPVDFVGIDIHLEKGYLLSVASVTASGLRGIPTRHPLDCNTIKSLWQEVDFYWERKRRKPPKKSRFS